MNRMKQHVDLVHRLGMKHMRHDVTAFTIPPEKMTIAWFEERPYRPSRHLLSRRSVCVEKQFAGLAKLTSDDLKSAYLG